MNWEAISREAEKLGRIFHENNISLNIAERVIRFYLTQGYTDEALSSMTKFLKVAAENPPTPTRNARESYAKIRSIWQEWIESTPLRGRDIVSAWVWGAKLAKSFLKSL